VGGGAGQEPLALGRVGARDRAREQLQGCRDPCCRTPDGFHALNSQAQASVTIHA
jgi:hypothetical protein